MTNHPERRSFAFLDDLTYDLEPLIPGAGSQKKERTPKGPSFPITFHLQFQLQTFGFQIERQRYAHSLHLLREQSC